MKDLLSTMLDLGLGIVAITKERAEAIVDELVKQGRMSKEEGSDFIKKIIEKGKQSEIEIQKKIETIVQKKIKEYNIATREEINTLKREIEQLKKQKK